MKKLLIASLAACLLATCASPTYTVGAGYNKAGPNLYGSISYTPK